jgi:hypothetical protein
LLDQWQTNHHTFVGRRGQLMAPWPGNSISTILLY